VKQTQAQILLGIHLEELRIFASAEYKFCDDREWRFDWANREAKIAFECNGGQWSGGHRRGFAVEQENEKINTAILLGWKVLQFTNAEILNGRAKAYLAEQKCQNRI
jgi:very-short-patch-repair endonuclease